MMNSQTISRRRATLIVLLAAAFAAPAATLALPTDAPELGTPRHADAPSISSVWEQPATPAPVIVVRPPEAQPPAPERALSPNPLWEIPLSTLSTTRERPIFSPSRRPPPPVVAAAPPLQPPPPLPKAPRVERPQFSLVGTVISEEGSFGIFVDQTTKAALRLKIGEDHQGWKLRSVQGREVMLEHDQQTTILSLPQPGSAVVGQPLLRTRGEGATAQRETDPQRRDERR